MGSKQRNSEPMSSTDEIKIVKSPEQIAAETAAAAGEVSAEGEEAVADATQEAPAKPKKAHVRSSKYTVVRAQVDKTKLYEPKAAIELIKKLSYTKFDGMITAHAVVKEEGMSTSLTLPHSTGKSIRVAIADDALLADIAAGKIEFDALVAAPQFMGKLARFAPVLGPKGLMPNPKNGTLTGNPEAAKKKLEAGTTTIKTEKKAPLFHVQIGKVSMKTEELTANLNAVIKALSAKLDSVTIAATMSPGVKVNPVVAK